MRVVTKGHEDSANWFDYFRLVRQTAEGDTDHEAGKSYDTVSFAASKTVAVVPAAAFSMHERHKQSRYLLRSSALVSSLNLISVHQQPVVRLSSQAKDCPHASQVCALFRTGRILVIDFGSIALRRKF